MPVPRPASGPAVFPAGQCWGRLPSQMQDAETLKVVARGQRSDYLDVAGIARAGGTAMLVGLPSEAAWQDFAFLAAKLEAFRRLENAGGNFLGHIAAESTPHQLMGAGQLGVLLRQAAAQFIHGEVGIHPRQQLV